MRRILTGFTCVFALLGGLAISPPSVLAEDIEEQTSAASLFDGDSLAGWIEVGEAEWKAQGREIRVDAGAGDGMLMSAQTYQDFRLVLEFNPDQEVNSGVFIRCQDEEDITPLTCYEINIWDNHPRQEFRTGSIVALAYPPLAHVDSIGKWNRLEISAEGDAITVWVNGTKTASLIDSTHSSGFIALQRWEGGAVRFRGIAIEE